MPYCNQCGRYIGGGMLCAKCGETMSSRDEEGCRGLDGLPTPDGVDAPERREEINEETPSYTGTTPMDGEEGMDVHEGEDVPGDVTGEVVSEGRTIVTSPEEEEETPPATERHESREDPRRTTGARFGRRIGEWVVKLFSPRAEETDFPPHEMREGRWMAILCYLGVLWAIPYFFARSNRYVAHHLERGLNILLMDCLGLTLGAVALALGVVMPILMPLAAAAAEVVLLSAVSVSIWSMVRVASCAFGHVGDRRAV